MRRRADGPHRYSLFSAQPKLMPSHSMRATLAMLPLASGSEVPRPITASSVSARGRSKARAVSAASIRSAPRRAALARCRGRARTRSASRAGHIGVEDRRHVVFDVASGEQHAGHGEHVVHAPSAQSVQTLAEGRSRELQEAAFQRVLGQAAGETADQTMELAHRVEVARAVAADHDPIVIDAPWPVPVRPWIAIRVARRQRRTGAAACDAADGTSAAARRAAACCDD